MRDDFSKKTRRVLAGRAGNVCSVPTCRLPTEGAAAGRDDRVTDVGIAAHITAAASGGPRYDARLTPEERKSVSNGIWCCAIHGRQIDSDYEGFPVEKLRTWKLEAEDASLRAILKLERREAGDVLTGELDAAEIEYMRRLRLPAGDDLATVGARLRVAARNDLLAMRRGLKSPDYAISLNLRMLDRGSETSFQVSGLAAAITTFNELIVVAPPGTGKTTTLLLAADAMLAQADLVPLFVPLGEWSSQSITLHRSVLERAAFDGETENHLRLLASHGRLVLLLDGWNELDSASRKRLNAELKGLRRDFVQLGVVISTRRQALDVPLSGPTVAIDMLSESQQLAIAKAIRAEAGEALLDHAWRTPGIRELVTIPLYLAALMARTTGNRLPTTKEEVLRLFLEPHEQAPERAEALRAVVHGLHADYLAALANEATSAESVSVSDARARRAVASASGVLVQQGQLDAPPPQPSAVLEALVDNHVLVRAGIGSVISFQHQQFQEFYAAERAESLMRAAVAGDENARGSLRKDVLNRYAWEEAILFACERASRAEDGGVEATAVVVREALTIDPMLAAEAIFRSSDELWRAMGAELETFAVRWHRPGKVDRAFCFMVKTGRPEFAPYVWSLISHADDQVHLKALRAAGRFCVSVLGLEEEAVARLRELPGDVRSHILSEIVMYGGYDGIEFASRIAQGEDDSTVRAEVVGALMFRRAIQHVDRVLEGAPDKVWRQFARKGYSDDDIGELAAAKRIRKEKENYEHAETDPLRRLSLAVHGRSRQQRDDVEVQGLIENPEFPVSDREQRASATLHEAFQLFPGAVRRALVYRAVQGLPLPFRAHEYFEGEGALVDDGPLVAIVLDPNAEKERAALAAKMVGPATIDQLIDQVLAAAQRIRAASYPENKPFHDERRRLADLISGTNIAAFVQAMLSRSAVVEPNSIYWLADLIARHGDGYRRSTLLVSEDLQASLVQAIQRWGEALLASADTTREHMAEVADAMERVPSGEFVGLLKRMLDEDLKRRRKTLEEARLARASGKRPTNDAHMSWTLQYRRAFAKIATDEVAAAMIGYLPDMGHAGFGEEAAYVLLEMWMRENRPTDEEFRGLKEQFADVEERRAERSGAARSSAYGDAIFHVVDEFGRPECEEAKQIHALKLAKVAVSMPFVSWSELIGRLLALPAPYSAKLSLLIGLVVAGAVVSADVILAGVRDLLEEAKTHRWLLDENQGTVSSWLSLLPFSDRPIALLEAIEMLPAEIQTPWRLDRVISALGCAPGEEAEQVLKALADRDARFVDHYEWFNALERRKSASSVQVILGLLEAGTFKKTQAVDRWGFVRRLAATMENNPGIRADVYGHFEAATSNPERAILKEAIVEAADNEGLLLLIRSAAQRGENFGGELFRAVERVAISRRPVEGWAGAYELAGQPLPDLRRELFAYVRNTTAEGSLAQECLNAIDRLRDDHGPAVGEPRHPDIDSGLPWPIVG